MMFAIAFAAALLAQVGTGSAPAQPVPAATASPAGDATVCRSITDTGTRFSHKECHTATEWRAIQQAAQEQVQQDQRLSSGSSHGGPQ